MYLDRLSLVFFLAVALTAQLICAADDKTSITSPAVKIETEAGNKLRFVKTTLLNGPTAQDRLDAVAELLYSNDKSARQILLDTLAISDNSPARQAIFQSIINSSSAISDKDDFREPLLAILSEDNDSDAKFAAQATLIFEFNEISKELKKIINTPDLDRNIRLNALYALQLRPVERQAVAMIASHISDPDTRIAQSARQALPYWIPAGMSGKEIDQYVKHLSQNEITRRWIDFQEKEARRLENESQKWQKLYISSLSREYDLAVDNEKGNILLSRLGSDLSPVRLWALDKIAVLSPSVVKVLPPQFNTLLLGLLSDSDRDVRLTTAQMFSNMSDRNPAAKLLTQFNVEKFDDIKLELFKALGEACHFAFSTGSTFKLPEDIRSSTLIISELYLSDNAPDKAAVAAEVIRKMLEPNGLEHKLVTKYLQLLSSKFVKAKTQDTALAVEILDEMARLCSQASHRDITAKLYGLYFLEGLEDKDNEPLRRTSVMGLVNINKTTAFEIFKTRLMMNDPSENIRSIIIELAGQTGKSEDIKWLAERLNANGEAAVAWEAIKEILQRQKASEIAAWADRLDIAKVSQDRIMVLLAIGEKKAEVEKDVEIINEIRSKLRPMQLDVYLKAGSLNKAVQILIERLKEGDMSVDNPLSKVIEAYLNAASLEQKTAFIEALKAITAAGANITARPVFQRLMEKWKQTLNPIPTTTFTTIPIPDAKSVNK